MKIAIFDSGIGGLSLLHRAMHVLPDADYIYYADEDHVPYGEKTPEEIHSYLDRIFPFLIDRGADAIVIACNTATTAADHEYRSRFSVPIVGMEPALKRALDLYGSDGRRILVTATPVTIRGPKLADLIERYDTAGQAELHMLPGLVHLAEEGNFDSDIVTECLEHELGPVDPSRYSALVFGCTHFCYFSKRFREYLGDDIHFVDGSMGTLRQLMRVMGMDPDAPRKANDDIDEAMPPQVEYYFSGRPLTAEQEDFIALCLHQLGRVRLNSRE